MTDLERAARLVVKEFEASNDLNAPSPNLENTLMLLREAVQALPSVPCPKCGGRGEYLVFHDRPGGPPSNQLVKCECKFI